MTELVCIDNINRGEWAWSKVRPYAGLRIGGTYKGTVMARSVGDFALARTSIHNTVFLCFNGDRKWEAYPIRLFVPGEK